MSNQSRLPNPPSSHHSALFNGLLDRSRVSNIVDGYGNTVGGFIASHLKTETVTTGNTLVGRRSWKPPPRAISRMLTRNLVGRVKYPFRRRGPRPSSLLVYSRTLLEPLFVQAGTTTDSWRNSRPRPRRSGLVTRSALRSTKVHKYQKFNIIESWGTWTPQFLTNTTPDMKIVKEDISAALVV
ncbi:hypothetical protein BDN72DRAFT_386125 [Pluteus cervinus]|uniref:Uncharacterized protein n=1 Tax=Pluteus cervinus TaxID=181527 RepID=A0ACD3A9X9_9AGAR|nr:hypothetical protein BDN72DRAFT_386125 [Pluteus cervinus]